MRVWLYPGFRRSLANNPWGSSVCIISGSGCCSLLCSCVVPDCSTCLLLASLCYYTYTSIEQTKPKTANERRVVGLCMSSYFQCCVLDQGGLLCFPFFKIVVTTALKWWCCFCPTQSLQCICRWFCFVTGTSAWTCSHYQLVKKLSLVCLASRGDVTQHH